MKRAVLLFVACALLAPGGALADKITVTPSSVDEITALTDRNDDNLVFDGRVTNGYYTAFAAGDYYKGSLYQTTQTGAWDMNAFHIGVYVPAAGDHTIPVEFWEDDGGFPYPATVPPVLIASYNVSFSTASSGGYTLQVDVAPITIPSGNVWMSYGNPGVDYGVLHVDLATIGWNMHDNGWYQSDSTGEYWYWYGGTPFADLYGALNMVPEPASLLLLVVGGLALRRR